MPDLSSGSPFAWLADIELGHRPYNPPTPLYRYMERRYAELAVEAGLILLGSPERYRDQAMPGEVRDVDEGRQQLVARDADLSIEHPHAFTGWQSFGGNVIVNDATNQIYVGNSWGTDGVDNFLLLCLTPRLDAALMTQFNPANDCALLVDDPIGLFITIAQYLRSSGRVHSAFLGRCSYDGRSVFTEKHSHRERALPRALLKRPDHAHHEEVRMVFPTAAHADHEVFTIPDIRRYLRVITP